MSHISFVLVLKQELVNQEMRSGRPPKIAINCRVRTAHLLAGTPPYRSIRLNLWPQPQIYLYTHPLP